LFCAASLEHGFPAFFPGLPFFFGSFFLGKQKERTRRQGYRTAWIRGCHDPPPEADPPLSRMLLSLP
jgi:hypothetical protein